MGEKTYVIDDKVVIKEKYLRMSKEERRKAIRDIISEDDARRKKIALEHGNSTRGRYTEIDTQQEG